MADSDPIDPAAASLAEEGESEPPGRRQGETEPQWRRRRRLDAVFGDDLPATTSDERGPGSGGGYTREWYERNRPPHHG